MGRITLAMWVYHRLLRTRISCCASHHHTKGICKAGRGRSTSAGNKKPLCFLRKYDGFSLFWRFLVYLFSLVFLEGEEGKRLWAFCPQCSFRLLNLEWAEYKMLSVIPKVKEALTAAALLDTCAHVLQCWAHTTAGESMLKLHLLFCTCFWWKES